jgi:sterol carrier protein 2
MAGPNRAVVVGVGMTPFVKPGQNEAYDVMAQAAVSAALRDAGIEYGQVQQVYAGYVYGDSACGQRAVYPLGMTGVPVFNVNNNCATGSTALFLARQAVVGGMADCVLALGFEQMQPGALGDVYSDRPSPLDAFNGMAAELLDTDTTFTLRLFGGAGQAHMRKYGTKLETFARIRAKASRHAQHNPLAVLKRELTVEDVMADKVIWAKVMTRSMACPPTCGAAAAVVVSESFARRHGLRGDVVIVAQALTTDRPDTFAERDMIQLVGAGLTATASRQVYEAAGIGPDDLDVIELHDCFAQNELITYEGLGLCGDGGGEAFVMDGDNTYGGQVVTNPSGGLLSKGHPLGATGLAQCYELTHQLRGQAGGRQVDGVRHALQHNLGLGGACVVTLFGRA